MEKSSLPIWIRKKPFRVTLGGAVGRSCRNWGRAGKHHAVQCRLRWSQFCCNCVNRKKNVCCFHMIWFKKNILCISYPLILQKKKQLIFHLQPCQFSIIFPEAMRARPPPRCHNRSVTSRAVPSSFPWRERELPWLPGHLRWLVSWWVGGLVVFNLWKIFFTKKTWDRSEGIKKMIGEDQRDGNKNDEW